MPGAGSQVPGPGLRLDPGRLWVLDYSLLIVGGSPGPRLKNRQIFHISCGLAAFIVCLTC